jgi:hypothetical protein
LVVDGQETASSTVPAGKDWLAQVAPPSVVVRISPPALVPSEFVLSPTATQSVADGQETPSRGKALGAGRFTQVCPPSEVVRMTWELEPIAMQLVGVEQETSWRPPVGAGWLDQVFPSLLVVTMASSPTATQFLDLHEVPVSGPVPGGTFWLTQLLPPSVVATISGGDPAIDDPVPRFDAATQTETVGHETADKSCSAAFGTLRLTHVLPPSVVVKITGPA